MAKKASGPGHFYEDSTFTQLTAAGNTSSVKVNSMVNHTFQVTVAAINTNVIVSIEGSNDDSSFSILPLDGTPVTGLTIGAATNLATITANGTYSLVLKNVATQFIRFDFVSESGGAAATIDVTYTAHN